MELHPFAQYIAILGRGKTKSRALTQEEARDAMGMILRDEVLPEQLGAFMLLQRYKEETPEEVAGFVEAVRDQLVLPKNLPSVDMDWSSYAGKRLQLPWFILSALTLSRNGYKVFMHGTEGHTPNRLYTREALDALGFPVLSSLEEAATELEKNNFAYVPLEVLSTKLKELIELRPILGLRTPVHTFARMINPFNAKAMLQGIFHRGFMETHTEGGRMVGQKHLAVFRGEGGEIERKSSKPTEVWSLHDGITTVDRWPRLLDDDTQRPDEDMDIQRLATLWTGESQEEYGEAAVIGTLAIALHLMGVAKTTEEADRQAAEMWHKRDKKNFAKAA